RPPTRSHCLAWRGEHRGGPVSRERAVPLLRGSPGRSPRVSRNIRGAHGGPGADKARACPAAVGSLVLPSPDCLRLIAITDDLRDGVDGLHARAAAAVRGGATMIQLRLKDLDPRDLLVVARALVSLPVPVIVNDRADVALAAGAAGAHV